MELSYYLWDTKCFHKITKLYTEITQCQDPKTINSPQITSDIIRLSISMDELFSEWVRKQIETRHWTQSKLAKQAGVSRSAINNLLNGNRKPGDEMCKALANAFKLPPEDLFRRAGILPPKTLDVPKVAEICEIARVFNDQEQDDLLEYARMRLRIKEEREKYGDKIS